MVETDLMALQNAWKRGLFVDYSKTIIAMVSVMGTNRQHPESYQRKTFIVRCRYNAVNFPPNPIDRPLGRDMGCILGAQTLDLYSVSVMAVMYVILDRVITALDCIFGYFHELIKGIQQGAVRPQHSDKSEISRNRSYSLCGLLK